LQGKTEKMIKQIDGINSSCDSAPATPPTNDFIISLQNARVDADALLKDVDQLKLEGEKLKREGSGKIWIEAENETRSSILPHTEAWHSHKWTQSAPWRPPLFGTGYWYLSRGGEYLEYQFTVSAAGTYNVWIRDYVDKFQPKGVRVIVINFDGKKYGAFPEVDKPAPGEKGVLGWHKVGKGIALNAGSHLMRITKEASTSGAAVLDAFYLTTGSDTPPEK
ncbi:MAG: hypothetical protein Q8L57_01760, partial [bacterium]|nr:hypothetical protein [bacterium]